MATKIICDRCGNEAAKPLLCWFPLDSDKEPPSWPLDQPARVCLFLFHDEKKARRQWEHKDLCPECLDELSLWMQHPLRARATGRKA